MTPIVINACTGRMGQELLKVAINDNQVEIVGAMAREQHKKLGTDIGYLVGMEPQGVFVGDDLSVTLNERKVLIDFSLPEHSIETLAHAVSANSPVVIGTTGFSDEQKGKISEAAKSIPIVFAANYSLGVNSLLGLVKQATKLLGDKSDIEIFEAHHKYKKDSPSGTALALGEAVAESKGQNLDDVAEWARHGIGEREPGAIGFSVMRAGEIVGTHEVVFALKGELVTLRHEAQTRQCFAQGAIEAAKWLLGKPAGLYDMQDVLGLSNS